MNEGEHGEVDAIRLLRAIVDQAMQENGFKDVQGAVGISVVPATAPAAVAGMDLSTPRYHAAIEQLLEAGALEHEHETNRRLASIMGDPRAFSITSGAIEPSRKMGA